MIPDDLLSLCKALRRIDRNIDRFRPAIQDYFGQAQPDCRRDLESGSAESTIHIITLGAGCADHGMLIGSDAVIPPVRAVQMAVLHGGDPFADPLDGLFDEPFFGMIR